MPHCSANYPWYLMKFALGFASILFLYMGFLKEKQFLCVCGPRRRQWERTGEKRFDRCVCRKGFGTPVQYGCGCSRKISPQEFDENCAKGRRSSIVTDAAECCCSRKRH